MLLNSKRAVAVLFGLALAAGCNSYKSPANLPTVPITIGTKTFTVEIAATDKVREHGLMQRDSMPDNWGMIFVFADVDVRGFWMKNTGPIPLDIVYLDENGKVVSVHTMQPYDEKNTTFSKGPAKYAVELNKGQAAACGVKEGDKVAIPEPAKNANE